MSWTDVFPVFPDDLVRRFEVESTEGERIYLADLVGVERVINPQSSKHVLVTSLFWKNARSEEGDLPPITRDLMKNALDHGLVSRFSPWEHYVQPLLEGASYLQGIRPDVVFRVYLAADLEFLVEDLVAVGCEVFLMRGSSLRHNPGAMWRFLALEEEGRWVTVLDADLATEGLHDLERTESALSAGFGLWRTPYIFDSVQFDNDPSYYRPINACRFGAVGKYPVALLMRAFLWATLRGLVTNHCLVGDARSGKEPRQIHGSDWPTYGFDEWFLTAVVFPRWAALGVLTLMSWNERQANHWFALDVEYVTWAAENSEILFFGEAELLYKIRQARSKTAAVSEILEGMLREKIQERGSRVLFPRSKGCNGLTLVVARYRENLRWLLQVPEDIKVVVYNKGARIRDRAVLARIDHYEKLKNCGRESDTYLHHLQSYSHDGQDAYTAFCQGDPFPHSPNFLELLKVRGDWQEVQVLTGGYAEHCEVPPATARMLDDQEWIGDIPLRTELCSAYTLDILGWQDEVGGRRFFRDYCEHHRLKRGMSISGHFLEQCGLEGLAKEAWRAALVQFAYGAIFGVRNERLPLVPRECLSAMREVACGHYSNGYVFERMWLHLFGLPFIGTERNIVSQRLTDVRRLEA